MAGFTCLDHADLADMFVTFNLDELLYSSLRNSAQEAGGLPPAYQ